MGFFRASYKEFFCAFCKTERRIKDQKHIQFFEITMSLLAGFILMLFIWQGFDTRVFVFVSIFLVMFEFLVQISQRVALACPHCGFDPILYKKNTAKCVEKVRDHLEKRKSNPEILLSRRARLDLPVVKKTPASSSQMSVEVSRGKGQLDLRM